MIKTSLAALCTTIQICIRDAGPRNKKEKTNENRTDETIIICSDMINNIENQQRNFSRARWLDSKSTEKLP